MAPVIIFNRVSLTITLIQTIPIHYLSLPITLTIDNRELFYCTASTHASIDPCLHKEFNDTQTQHYN